MSESDSVRYIPTSKGPVAVRNASQARWARINDTPEDVRMTRERWEELRAEAIECAYCGMEMVFVTMDHMLPLSRGGLHTEDNIVACCEVCNCEKGDRTPEEFGFQPYWWRDEREAD